ncbi:MAG: hypothetical protein N0E58_09850 [Candidatus Thiodiazotropha endolucinida]|uniref:Uncharacterized protein n=1 Tax=Candidatus Thiodiazotropha taylori TaxID=2792791 RepID=A0A9E4NKD5_9GAMM|nr:hypothetical protein [Candidatus Thiodiazotropha taylori]MCW4236550.1 hypothetical protein [Candidatus Thiodiazotropha endolucinida]
MDIKELSENSLGPFDNLALIRRYFANVKAMDAKTLEGDGFDVGEIMELWHKDGMLRIRGRDSIGEKTFKGAEEISSFYINRTRGVDGALSSNLSKIDVANAKNSEHVVASGIRYIVTKNGEGLQAPFTHNFILNDGKIESLDIHVGKANKSEIAPLGALQIEDMGRLSAMAWMVA